jgi:hypothetical protein
MKLYFLMAVNSNLKLIFANVMLFLYSCAKQLLNISNL